MKNYFLTKGWLHLFLLSCGAIFLFPFLWMLSSSFKTDEDALEDDFLAPMPEARMESPYLRDEVEFTLPEACPVASREAMRKLVLDESLKRIQDYAGQPRVIETKKAELQRRASVLLASNVVKKIPYLVWAEGDDAVRKAYAFALKHSPGGEKATIAQVFADVQARLCLNSVKLRSMAGAVEFEQNWKDTKTQPKNLTVSNAELLSDVDGKWVVKSEFSNPDQPAEIKYSFDTELPYKQFHRLVIGMDKDDSWHRFDAKVKVNGVEFKATRSMWLAQHRPESLILQFPNDDRVEFGKRPWIELEPEVDVDVPAREVNQVELVLTLHPSSEAQAARGKLQRNYMRVLRSMPFWKSVGNSIVMTVLIILGTVFSSCFVAYAFARLRWPGRSIALLVLLSTMMVPPQVTMIQQFIIWREVGWYNTLHPIWVPAWFGNAFFIFLMVQQMKGIPRDLEEAAQVDGMNRLQIWWYVIVPLVKPAMAAIAIMSFMAAWNEFMAPLIYLRDMDRFPLSVSMYALAIDDGSSSDMPLLMAGNLLMTLPVIVIFFLFQRYFIQGVASSGVKG